MMNLRPHHRVHIPNTLAIFAVVLLLISSATGFVTSQEADASGQQVSVKADSTGNESINTSASKKSRGLNLGLLLFRRG